ncbi:MAG: hypothetical protein ACRDSZ_11075 [Pseudonocardiaceae bacterium]
MLVGVGAYVADSVQEFLNSVLPTSGLAEQASGPPIEILDVQRNMELTGDFLLPNGVSDQQLAAWDRGRRPTAEWLRAADAMTVGISRWEITLVGKRSDAVAITNMRPVIAGGQCRAPIGGTLIENGSAGADPRIILETEIDSPTPLLKYDDPRGNPQPFFPDHSISLPQGEKNTIVIIARTSGPYCEWTIDVDYLADGRRATMTVTAPGDDPFAVTGRIDPQRYDSVFLDPLRRCSTPRPRISGAEYSAILQSEVFDGSCAGR